MYMCRVQVIRGDPLPNDLASFFKFLLKALKAILCTVLIFLSLWRNDLAKG